MDRPRLLLIDGHALVYRAFFAMPALSNSRGEMTNAAYGFTSMLIKALADHRPTHAIAAFDPPGPTFRHEVDATYKAQRRAMPDELRPQVPWCREICAALRIPMVEREGFEADDVIGTLSRKAVEAGADVLILTADLDSLQLVDEHTTVIASRRGITESIVYDVAAVRERFGFDPIHTIDYKALRGDASDNIPGVPGIGEKTAMTLVQQYGSLEGILDAVPSMKPGKVRSVLEEHREQAIHSKWMATVRRDVDVELDLDAAKLLDPGDAAHEIFDRLEFRTLLARLPTIAQQPAAEPAQLGLEIEGEPWEAEVTVVADAHTAELMLDELSDCGDLGIQTLLDDAGIPLGVALVSCGDDDAQVWYAPYGRDTDARVSHAVRQILESPALKHGYDLKTQLLGWRRRDIELHGAGDDLLLQAYLVNTRNRVASLDALARDLCGRAIPALDVLLGSGRGKRNWREVPVEDAAPVVGAHAGVLAGVRIALRRQLEEAGLTGLYTDIERPLVPVLAAMEGHGVRIDIAQLEALSAELGDRIAAIEAELHGMAGYAFNIGSTQRLASFLYDDLGLASGRKTKTGRSTDAETLESLREEHPAVPLVLEWRQLSKLKSTYVDALPVLSDADDRIHTSFNQAVATTGRLSSADPNLQNIPVRTEWGRRIRRAFVADPGNRLISADYSQVELRILAHLSGEQDLIESFARKEDIHRRTAAVVYGVDPEAVTADMRRIAKVVNFGVLYGLSDFGLARDTGMPREEAAAFIASYFARFPAVTRYLEEVRNRARESGFAETAMGRRRYLPDIRAANRQIRGAAERMAVNMPMQGTAADIMKRAMLRCDAAMREQAPSARLLLQVHDELVAEAPEADVNRVAELMREAMEGAAELRVPLDVDVKTGENWADMTPLQLVAAG